MAGWGALIVRHWQVAALVVAAFVFGLLRLRTTQLDAALERARAERDRLAGYRDTRKEIDDAPYGNDPDAARRFLHERGQAERP